MGDESSYDEDFSEMVFCQPEIELPKKETKKEESPFEILSMEKIFQEVLEMALLVRNILELPTTVTARALLNYYKWDSQRLIGEYYDNGCDMIFQQAKVENPFNIQPNRQHDVSEDCKICYSDTTPDNLYSLPCGHKYCKTCWNQYLTEKIVNDALNELIVCPEQSCNILVDDEDIVELVIDPDIIFKYHRSMTKSFVQNNRSIVWCPSPGCSYAAKKIRTAKCVCICICGYEFCFECLDYWHEPVNCAQLKQWKNSDSETFKWIAEHAKVCPNGNCEAIIEKNGGCNHMTCRLCKYEFCWICMQVWQGHQACNRFNETKFVGHRELARFKHFQERYIIQLESLRIEGNLYRDIEGKVNDLKDKFSMTNNETRFLRDAVRVLHISRRTLTYTFVFAYFLKKNNHVEIFEDNQSDLETAVERLSEFLEEELNDDTIVELKQCIQESFKYCETRCKVLIDHIRDAEENHLWETTA